MKTAIIVLLHIILNTSEFSPEPFARLVNGIEAWMLIALEAFLLIIFYVYHIIKGLKENRSDQL